jgi:hypothetical protein
MIERSLDWETLFTHPKSIGRFAANLAADGKRASQRKGIAYLRDLEAIPKT